MCNYDHLTNFSLISCASNWQNLAEFWNFLSARLTIYYTAFTTLLVHHRFSVTLKISAMERVTHSLWLQVKVNASNKVAEPVLRKFLEALWFIQIRDFTRLRSFPIMETRCWELSLFHKTASCLSLLTENILVRKSILSRITIIWLYVLVKLEIRLWNLFIIEIREFPCLL